MGDGRAYRGRPHVLVVRVLGEPGAETTPWPDSDGVGWEDDLGHPRTAAELVMALDTTWAVLDAVVDRWTPEMLDETIERRYGNQVTIHSRSSILQRLLTHEAYHCGDLSQTLGIEGLPQIDLWRADWTAAPLRNGRRGCCCYRRMAKVRIFERASSKTRVTAAVSASSRT